jgi:hypothetical protein
VIDLRFHEPSDLAMALGAAPHLAFRPKSMLAQLMDGGVAVSRDLIRKGQADGIEDPRLSPEVLEQTGCLFDRQSRIGAGSQRSIKQQNARAVVEWPQASCGVLLTVCDVKCW